MSHRGLRSWAIRCSLPRPLVGRWIGSKATGARTDAHMDAGTTGRGLVPFTSTTLKVWKKTGPSAVA